MNAPSLATRSGTEKNSRIELALEVGTLCLGVRSLHSVGDVDHEALTQKFVAVVVDGRGDAGAGLVGDGGDVGAAGDLAVWLWDTAIGQRLGPPLIGHTDSDPGSGVQP
jgi:hypothetical protein